MVAWIVVGAAVLVLSAAWFRARRSRPRLSQEEIRERAALQAEVRRTRVEPEPPPGVRHDNPPALGGFGGGGS